MVPAFIINGHDYAEYIQELKPSRNDLDADGSGRNILDGLMHRKRISSKLKYSVSFIRLNETMTVQLSSDMWPQYIQVTMLDPKTNQLVEKTYYTSTINYGVQRYIGGETVYDGISFDITER